MSATTFIAAGKALSEEELLNGVRTLIASYFNGHAIKALHWAAQDIDAHLSNMLGEVASEDLRPSEVELAREIEANRAAYLDRAA